MKSAAQVLYENQLILRAKLLDTLTNGQIPSLPPTLDILNIRDADGNTALLKLLSSASIDKLEMSKGATPDVVDHRFNGVKYLVENGADVNVSNDGDRTPLGFAFMFCTFEVIEYLLSKNAIFDPNHERTLHALAILGCDEKIQFLMKIQDTYQAIPSPSINLKDDTGKTPLWCAAELSRLETVELLIKLGADHLIVPENEEMPHAEAIKHIIKNRNGFPIMEALKEVGQKDAVVLEKVKAMVRENPNTLNTILPHFFQNILHVAAIKGRLNCIRYFLEECDWQNAMMALTDEDRYTHNPIEAAFFENKIHVVKYMVDYVRKNKINIELLHRAVQHADICFLKYLIDECGFDINYQTKGFLKGEGVAAVAVGVGYTPLHLTVVIMGEFEHSKFTTYQKYERILDYLMNHPRMDLSIKDKMQRTLLHLAARYQNIKLTHRLLEANIIDINLTFPALCEYENLTPLHMAILNPYYNLIGFSNISNENVATIVELLVKHGANPGAVFFEKSEARMPIDYAIHNRFYEAARFLVSQKAKVVVSNFIENVRKIFDMLQQPEYIYPESYQGKRIVLMFESSEQASKMRDYIMLMFNMSDVQIKSSSLCFPLIKELKKEHAYLNYFDSISKADAVVAKHKKLFALLGEHFSNFTMKSASFGFVTYSYFLRDHDVRIVLNNLKVSLSKFKVSWNT
jgi:ankyrin repeat protein